MRTDVDRDVMGAKALSNDTLCLNVVPQIAGERYPISDEDFADERFQRQSLVYAF
ncbi:MAG: hypothetical protein ACKO6L_07035 [Flavobacteriales bacterium]